MPSLCDGAEDSRARKGLLVQKASWLMSGCMREVSRLSHWRNGNRRFAIEKETDLQGFVCTPCKIQQAFN